MGRERSMVRWGGRGAWLGGRERSLVRWGGRGAWLGGEGEEPG